MKLRTQLFLGYVLVFSLMLVIAGVSYTGFSSHTDTSRWVSHTHEVIGNAHLIEKLLSDLETGQRGFLLTGLEPFLQPYEEGRELYRSTIDDLKQQVDDNPAQVRRLGKIDSLVSKWQRVAAKPEIEERRKVVSGAIDAEHLQLVLAKGVGKGILDEMRGIMDVMEENFRVDGNVKGEALTEAVAKAMVDQETGQRGYIITGKDEFLKPFDDGQVAFASAISAMRKLNANAYDIPGMKRDIRRLEQLSEEWLEKAANPEIAARVQMNQSTSSMKTVEAMIVGEIGKSVMDALRIELVEFVAIEEALLNGRILESELVANQSTYTVLFGTLAAIVLGVSGMFFTSRNIQRQVGGEPAEIAAITERISQGEFDVEIGDAESNTGIFASVATMAVFLRKNRDQTEVQDWFKTGQNQLNECMRGELSVLQLTDNVVCFLAEHLNAQVGAVYVVTQKLGESGVAGVAGESSTLQLAGTYAFTKRRGLNEEIQFGAGLVGQAALTQKLISVDRLPDDYTRISSATGEASPANIVVLPLIYGKELRGVIELAGLREFSDNVLEFLENVAETIAIGINSAQSRIQIQEALANTTDLANRLQIQQQSLANANQELEAKTNVLEEQKKQVESANEELEVTRAEIQAKADDLAQASRYKSEFLANMSHELRTPLNSLLILANSLSKNKTGNMNPDQVEKSRVIHDAGADLLRLINDILDLSKVESGKLDIQLEDVVVQDILDHIHRNFDPVSQEKGVDLIIELSPSLPVTLYTDEVRVEQIIRNLASNAFTFTESGSVTLRADSAPNNMIAFSMIDTGIGIASDQQRSIFEAFQQADGSIGRRFGGTGLGLSISRQLSGLLGGRIELESREGEGSTFTLLLPLTVNPNPNPGAEKSRSSKSRSPRAELGPDSRTAAEGNPDVKVVKSPSSSVSDDRRSITSQEQTALIIDDDPRFQNILVGYAHDHGFKTLAAEDGQSGLEMANRHIPDAIILDIQLPHLDGLSVLDALKQDAEVRDIPVYVISVADVRKESLDRGALRFLSKPVSSESLADMFEHFQSLLVDSREVEGGAGNEQRFALPRGDLEHALSGARILVVDDDMRNTFALGAALEEIGGTVVIAGNGQLALNALAQDDDFDIVIMDIMMPVMDGFQAMIRIRDMDHYREIPIVALTAMASKQDAENCIAAGANVYLTKPIDMDQLVSQMSVLLQSSKDSDEIA